MCLILRHFPCNLQDTAGHERYESMTRIYYRGAAACILCYDITDRTSFDRVRFWAGELKSTEQVNKSSKFMIKKVDINFTDDQYLSTEYHKLVFPL